ncbi:MAG: LCP family protein [Propionicimonas sp.]|uniref:LCP family protein n=1 Tax=Propionicimonas sp. TaxID=1955623 RepID=UPI003D0E767B
MATHAQPATALPSPLRRSQGIALRRALVLMGMTLVVPGSAQLAVGQRRLGRVAFRVWASIIALVLLAALLLLTPARGFVIGLYANPITLTVLQWLVPVLSLGWIFLLLDAWWLANPRHLSTVGKAVSGVLAVVLAATSGTVAWAASGSFATQAEVVGNVFGGGGSSQAVNGRINVLLLGGDAGADRTGLRPDSMTVASIDAETGRTVLFSLPRNLQHAPFPADSPLHAKYPDGYYCAVKDLSDACLLNGIYTLAVNNKKLFPGVKYPGVEATKGVIEEILGLKINYWAMIDLKGFKKLINAVGGIRLDIGKKVPIGSVDGPHGVYEWIMPGKNVHLDGFHALWFARSREYSSDYERMIRQKCVMNAMLRQLNPTTVLTKFQDIAKAGEEIVATNVPTSDLGTLLDLAMKGKTLPMASVSFTPPLITPATPDFAKIRSVVTESIAESEARDASPSASATASASPTTSSTPKKNTSTDTSNLDSICKVSG